MSERTFFNSVAKWLTVVLVIMFLSLGFITLFRFSEDGYFLAKCEEIKAQYQSLLAINCNKENIVGTAISFRHQKDIYVRVQQKVADYELSKTQQKQQLSVQNQAFNLQYKGLTGATIDAGNETYPELLSINNQLQRGIIKKRFLVDKKMEESALLVASFNFPVNDGFVQYYGQFTRMSTVDQNVNYTKLRDAYNETYAVVANRLYLAKNYTGTLSKDDFTANFTRLNTFSSQSFVALGDVVTKDIDVTPLPVLGVFGTDQANQRIATLALSKGYYYRKQADESKLVSVGDQRVMSELKNAFDKLKQGAQQDGISVDILSGYRSQKDQQQLFLDRLNQLSIKDSGKPVDEKDIAAKKLDSVIIKNLEMTSPPGFSKHQSGYTVDITDTSVNAANTAFVNTKASKWLSENNYFNAKRFGFIPSYPPQSFNIGPNPEPWEYIWIGDSALERIEIDKN